MPAGRLPEHLPGQSRSEPPGGHGPLLDVLGCETIAELQDLLSCLLLSEAVYKAAEGPPAAAAVALNNLRSELPPGLAPLLSVQYSRRSAEHRHLLARSATTLYVAFMGSKHPRDYLADANLLTRLLWSEGTPAGSDVSNSSREGKGGSSSHSRSEGSSTAAAAAAAPAGASSMPAAPAPVQGPAVHRGFLSRAEGVMIEALWVHARWQGLRLVLCGHSLGGAVAQLCTLRLLHALRSGPPPPSALRCLAFGAPPIGNAALAEHVRLEGWEPHFLSVALPEDPVPRLLLQPASPAAASEAAANQDALAAAEAQEQAAEAAGQAEGATAQAETAEAAASTPAAGSVLRRFPAVTASAALRAAGLAQRPFVAAAGAAAGAVRSARANVLPTFAHIGPQRLLLPHGTAAASAAAAAAAAGPAQPVPDQPAAQQQQQQQQWLQVQLLGLHSMAHYRSRVAALCHRERALHQQQHQQQHEQPAADPAVQLARSLAPAVEVRRAEAQLPVLSWAQPSSPASPQQAQQGTRAPVLLTVAVHGTGLELCTGALLRLPGGAGPAQPAVLLCNPAREWLVSDLPAAISAAAGGSGSGGSHGWLHAVGSAAKRAATAIAPGSHPQPPPQQAQPAGLVARFAFPPAALQQLAQQAKQQQQHVLSQPLVAELVLLSDYGRHAAKVQLRPAVVWVASTDAALGIAVLGQLQAAAADAAAAAAAAAEQQRWLWRPSLPSRAAVAAPLRGLWGRAGTSGSSGSSTSEPAGQAPQHELEGAPAGQQQPEGPRGKEGEQQQQQEQGQQPSVAQRLSGLRQRLAAHLHPPWQAGQQEQEQPAVAAVLLSDPLLLLMDATALLQHSSGGASVAEQLELAAEALRWSAGRRRQQAAGAGRVPAAQQQQHGQQLASHEEQLLALDQEEAEDEDMAELSHLGLAARLRRQVARASSAARRRALLLRHQRHLGAALAALPPPQLLLLVVSHRQLQAAGYGAGLDGAVLAAMRRVAGAAAACGGTPLLLAVGSSTPLSAPYRHYLADACGLMAGHRSGDSSGLSGSSYGSYGISGGSSELGSVVPLLLQPPVGGPGGGDSGWGTASGQRSEAGVEQQVQVRLLRAALQAYGAAQQQAWERQVQAPVVSRL